MRLYVESNFPLEIATRQPDFESCSELLERATNNEIELSIPAFSILEPYQTIERRRRDRGELYQRLTYELGQIARSADYREEQAVHREVIGSLIAAINRDASRFDEVRQQLEAHAHVIALDAVVLIRAEAIQQTHGLDSPDAVVLASILADLELRPTGSACFVTTNSRDFGAPSVMAACEMLNARVLFRFRDALNYVQSGRF